MDAGPMRQCSRTGCAERADATLTYQYGSSTAWLDPLWSARDPHAYDLCARHAGRVSVPQGWQLRDRRHGDGSLVALIAV